MIVVFQKKLERQSNRMASEIGRDVTDAQRAIGIAIVGVIVCRCNAGDVTTCEFQMFGEDFFAPKSG